MKKRFLVTLLFQAAEQATKHIKEMLLMIENPIILEAHESNTLSGRWHGASIRGVEIKNDEVHLTIADPFSCLEPCLLRDLQYHEIIYLSEFLETKLIKN